MFCQPIATSYHLGKVSFPNIHDLFVFVIKFEISGLQLERYYPFIYDLARLVVQDLKRIVLGVIPKNAEAVVPLICWKKILHSHTNKRQNLAWMTVFARFVSEKGMVFEDVEAVHHYIWNAADLL